METARESAPKRREPFPPAGLGGELPDEPRSRPHERPFHRIPRILPYPRRRMVPGALGTETRQPLHFGHRGPVSQNVPSAAPGPRRPFGSNAASPSGRVRGGGFAVSGARFAPVPGRRTRRSASMGHAHSPFADVAAERGGTRLGGTRELRPRTGKPPPLLPMRPPRTQISMATERGAQAARGRSRGIWPVPPLAGRVALPPSSRDTGASPASAQSRRLPAQLDCTVLRVLDFPRIASGPFSPTRPLLSPWKARILCC